MYGSNNKKQKRRPGDSEAAKTIPKGGHTEPEKKTQNNKGRRDPQTKRCNATPGGK